KLSSLAKRRPPLNRHSDPQAAVLRSLSRELCAPCASPERRNLLLSLYPKLAGLNRPHVVPVASSREFAGVARLRQGRDSEWSAVFLRQKSNLHPRGS